MRMFVAAVPPDQVLEQLEDFLSVRRDADASLRWTIPDQWHLTLAFLPAVPERAYDDLCQRLTRAARKRSPMTLSLAGGGAFPNPGRAKVLWAGVEVDDRVELNRFAAGCRAAATRAGVDVPGERFTPHVTLARSGRTFEATRWLRVLDAFRSREFQLEEVALIASHLGEGPHRRPRYEVLERFEVGDFRGRAVPKPDLDH